MCVLYICQWRLNISSISNDMVNYTIQSQQFSHQNDANWNGCGVFIGLILCKLHTLIVNFIFDFEHSRKCKHFWHWKCICLLSANKCFARVSLLYFLCNVVLTILIVLVNTPTSILKSPDRDSGLSSDENNVKGIHNCMFLILHFRLLYSVE